MALSSQEKCIFCSDVLKNVHKLEEHKHSAVVNGGACEASILLPGVRKTEVLISGKGEWCN